jgi:hypothetical protein
MRIFEIVNAASRPLSASGVKGHFLFDPILFKKLKKLDLTGFIMYLYLKDKL